MSWYATAQVTDGSIDLLVLLQRSGQGATKPCAPTHAPGMRAQLQPRLTQ